MSEIEETLALHMRCEKLNPVREFHFAKPRRWRFDFAFPEKMLAIECEGGTWNGGRHTRGKGFEQDCDKYNQAALLGWKVLRFTAKHVNSGEAITLIKRIAD